MSAIKKVLFLGGLWEDDKDEEIIELSKGSVQFAANSFQKRIIAGLDACLETPVDIVSGLFVGSYPKRYKQAFIQAREFNHTLREGHVDYGVPFLNFVGIKHFSMANSLVKTASRLIEAEEELDGVCVCGYAMTFSIVSSLVAIKKKYPLVTTCLIVPDLPQFMNLGAEVKYFREKVKNVVNKKMFSDLKSIDCFVVLTQYMYPELSVDKPYCIVEGIAPLPDDEPDFVPKKSKTVVYTGSLDSKYGIVELVDAFYAISDDEAQLHIYGFGDAVPYIEKLSKLDARIQYFGNVSNDVAREAQRAARLLVNPRSSEEEYTKYSFPSKTLEYMASGTPILMYKLKGIPDEYDQYLYYCDDGLEHALKKLLQYDERVLSQKGLAAQEFVRKRKNAVSQSRKIVKLLEIALEGDCDSSPCVNGCFEEDCE